MSLPGADSEGGALGASAPVSKNKKKEERDREEEGKQKVRQSVSRSHNSIVFR